jgi:hypothetical protein
LGKGFPAGGGSRASLRSLLDRELFRQSVWGKRGSLFLVGLSARFAADGPGGGAESRT